MACIAKGLAVSDITALYVHKSDLHCAGFKLSQLSKHTRQFGSMSGAYKGEGASLFDYRCAVWEITARLDH